MSLTCLLSIGCDAEQRTSTVVGRVTLDDQPLSSGSILLLSDLGDSGGAEVQSDGTFTLACNPGTYHVAVMPVAVKAGVDGLPVDPTQAGNAVEIPKMYQDVGSSEITVEVTEGENTLDVPLVSKPKK